ncbi:MAG TPA: hypothetical protein VF454_00315 [Gemmatimonadales bacterium]
MILVLLALLAMGWMLGNQFVQDDAGVMVDNALLRHWSGVWEAFAASYWPPRDSHELYRPLSIAWYTIQWQLGGGAPVLFRVVSLALYAGVTLAVWRLLLLVTPPGAAWLGAALFAVHPVHTEALAIAVNQSELIVALCIAIALQLRIRADRDPARTRAHGALIWLLFVVAVFTKEHALVLIPLLWVADLALDPAAWRTRLRQWGAHTLLLVVTAAVFWSIRTRILGGGTGTQIAEALEGSTMLGRAYTMLGVPAEWLRLLVWPAHLQSDWNLLEWVPTAGWSLRETAGAAALIAWGAGVLVAWNRRPVTAFGLLWLGGALAPVTNILIPSGILLAERTLFLPSIGFVLVVADLAGWIETRPTPLGRWPRLIAILGLGLLLVAGTARSAMRMGDWYNRPIFLAVQSVNSPLSWRVHLSLGFLYVDLGRTDQARLEFQRSLLLRADAPLALKGVADRMRRDKGDCAGPVLLYDELLKVLPGRSDIRGSQVACLLYMARYADARTEAERGIARGLDADYFQYVAGVADSAAAAGAPARTVRLKSVGHGATDVDTRRLQMGTPR